MKNIDQVLTLTLRETLKRIMKKEIEEISGILKELEPKGRLNMVCKLMPYEFPKVENMSRERGEPNNFGS